MMHPMANWFLEIGLYLIGIALFSVAGLLLVCWGLWSDRRRILILIPTEPTP